MKVNGIRFVVSNVLFVVLIVYQFLGCGGGPPGRQKQDSHLSGKKMTHCL